MGLEHLITDARKAAGTRLWGAAVELARDGAVVGVSDDGEEVHLRVKTGERALPFEVYLWPDDGDWGCDCDARGKVCLHVAAAMIAVNRAQNDAMALPAPEKEFRVSLRYDFHSKGSALSLQRQIVYPESGRVEPLTVPLSKAKVLASRSDAHAEALLALRVGAVLDADTLRKLFTYLDEEASVTLDDEPVSISREPVLFRVRVTDEGEGFKVGIYRPSGISKLYRGVARIGDRLHPTSHGTLTANQRKALIKGVIFAKDDIGRLVGDYIPHLRDQIPVDVVTKRLPDDKSLIPKVSVNLEECPEGLRMKGEIVYGEPPIARLHEGTFKVLGSIVPVRDLPRERAIVREFEERMGCVVGFEQLLRPHDAVVFLRDKLPKHKGPVKGKVDPNRYRVVETEVVPQLQVSRERNEAVMTKTGPSMYALKTTLVLLIRWLFYGHGGCVAHWYR